MPKEDQDRILTLVTEQLRSLPLDVIRDRKQLREYTMGAVTNAAATLGVALSPEMTAVLTGQATALAGGLGFLDDLLPPNRNDLAEIMLNPDGQLWLLPKGAQDPVPYDYRPSLDETWRAVEALRERGFRVLFLPDEAEAARSGALNFVTLGPRQILMAAGNPKMQAFLEAEGVTCHTVPVDELLKAAGGIGCLTGVVERAREL
jgi:hypothetical protein